MLKQLFIPVALFALSATGASAYSGTSMVESLNLGLSQTQISALQEAREVRSTSRVDAKKILQDAGITKDKLKEIRTALKTKIKAHVQAVKTAVTNNDYAAFKTATAGTKMAEKVSSEEDFAKFVQATVLFKAGDKAGAKEILTELGFEHIGAIAHYRGTHKNQ